MRTLSQNAIVSLNALETDNAFWFLVTIRHPDLPAPYRLVNNNEDVFSNGFFYTAFPFNLTLAVDDGSTVPSVQIEFDNIERELIDVIRGLTTGPLIDIQLVLSSNPNAVEMALYDLQMVDISYDMSSISGRLIAGDLLNAPYPCDSYDPAQVPGVFY